MFATPDEAASRAIIRKADPAVGAIAQAIQNRNPLPRARDRIMSGPVNALLYPLSVHDKKFTVTDNCVSCGKCAKRCPLDNITLTELLVGLYAAHRKPRKK